MTNVCFCLDTERILLPVNKRTVDMGIGKCPASQKQGGEGRGAVYRVNIGYAKMDK